MNSVHLARIDLNLLVLFEAVARCRSVTVASEQLALSPSALSHALKRLRALLADELVIRGRNGLVLTPRAESLLPKVQLILQHSNEVFNTSPFDPLTTTQCFRLAASDYSIATVIPKLIEHLNHSAPQAQLDIENYTPQTLERLEQGELEAAFIGITPPTSPFEHIHLFNETMIGLISHSHPLAPIALQRPIMLDEYLAYRHIVVSFKDPKPSMIDVSLNQLGRQRQIAIRSPNMLANIAALHQAPLIMNVPAKLVPALHNSTLITFELPITQLPQHYSLIWHKRLGKDSAFLWLLNTIRGLTF